MKTLFSTTIAAALLAAPSFAGDGWHTDFETAKKIAASVELANGTNLVLAPAAVPAGLGVQLVQAETERKKTPAPEETTGVSEVEKEISAAKIKLAELAKRIEADHVKWEKVEKEMEVSKARAAELKAALKTEQEKLKAMEGEVVKIEKRHNKDHEDEERLKKHITAKQNELKVREGRMDEISKLEKRAAELRKEAEELRKKAEELKNN